MDLQRVSAPLTTAQKLAVVSIQDLKDQERISNSYEDGRIALYIDAAYDYLSGPEGWLGRCHLLDEELELFAETLGDAIELPARPYRELVSFDVIGADGSYGAVDPSLYVVRNDELFAQVVRASSYPWPGQGFGRHPRAFRIRFKAGFGTAEAVPSPIKLGMTMLAAHFYQNREATFSDNKITVVNRSIEFGLKNLCGRYRVSPDHS